MTFRSRVLLACLAVAVAPLALFAFGARREVRARLTAQFEERVETTSARIRADLTTRAASLDSTLRAVARSLRDDASLRAALLQDGERAALLDFAGRARNSTGLDYLLLLDSAGTVLSSGHFRNEFDRVTTSFDALGRTEGLTLVATRRASGDLHALVRAHTLQLGARRFLLVGGFSADSGFVRQLAADLVDVTLQYPGGSISSAPAGARASSRYYETIALPFLADRGEAVTGEAALAVTHSALPLQQVRRAIDLWFFAAVAGAVLLAIVMAQLIAARVSRPLAELARRAARVDLERLDTQFATRRSDEIGALARTLDTMVQRLRGSAQQLRAAERRATVGDLARQVNHDVRNGLLPIRNVIRHLAEVAQDRPAELHAVFRERESTLQSGIAYLESLATNYARLSPRAERQRCAVNDTVRTVLEHARAAPNAALRAELSDENPQVLADPVALRRVLENLVVNAIESLDTAAGTVTLRTSVAGAAATQPADTTTQRRVIITVTDTGRGIEPAALDHIFDDFFTTRERGTGLGLSIVRRLLADMGGRIRVSSEPGRGTTFSIELPEAS